MKKIKLVICMMVLFVLSIMAGACEQGGQGKNLVPTQYTVVHNYETTYGVDRQVVETYNFYLGKTVEADQKVKDGYYFDAEDERNVLSGVLVEGKHLTLQCYYKLAE